ncbi:MAG: hypothetical protein JWR77_1976 [Rhizorhabdus sp.]|nr:hypothetical protein [Rhizorhabdus sp.]
MTQLDQSTASRFARLTLGHLTREYPNKLDHVMAGAEDVASPMALHPIFYGSFDWHSCVHGWWQVMRLVRRFPDLAESDTIRALADAMLVPGKVAGELAYLQRPASAGFERPYGWAWLLALHDELGEHDGPWADALAPLAHAFAARFAAYLPRLTYPVRVGTHFNIAFALVLALGWADKHDGALAHMIRRSARHWFEGDADCQAWEPGGDEFLSSALCEALLMSRVMPRQDFLHWFDRFLPHIAQHKPLTLFHPATVSDRADGKIAHLDGLNLSRSWCWRSIARTLGHGHPLAQPMRTAAEAHLHASLPHLADSYMGEHWLASFALLALEA